MASSSRRTALRIGFWTAAAGTVAVGAVLGCWGERLKTPQAPRRVVSLELAPDLPAVRCVLRSWEVASRDGCDRLELARRSIQLDFLFIAAYSALLGGACWWAAGVLRRRGLPGARALRALAWLQPVAGALDVVENLGMLAEIRRYPDAVAGWIPPMVAVSAGTKFVLVSLAALAIVGGLVARWWPRRGAAVRP